MHRHAQPRSWHRQHPSHTHDLTGTALAAPFALRVIGLARIALRYGERMATHDALFRALAAKRLGERKAATDYIQRALELIEQIGVPDIHHRHEPVN